MLASWVEIKNNTYNVPDMQGREFLWTDSDFIKVQDLIYQRAGISLHDGKHAMVYSRLSRRLRETGYSSFKDYLTWLEKIMEVSGKNLSMP
jgi:chemotaxis protein methyltransferase CheR